MKTRSAPSGSRFGNVIRVAVADDHPLFREGLRKAISIGPDLQLVGEASDGHEALKMCAREKPDVLLLDLAMPRCDGYGVLEQLFRVSPSTRALVLTMHPERGFEEKSLAAGARGFLQKDSSLATMLKAIRAVASDEVWASRIGTFKVLSAREHRRRAYDVLESLTARERQILGFLGRGMKNREMAGKTGLSERTIATHVANLIDKLQVRGRVEAALLARRFAGIPPDGQSDDGGRP